jgi:chitinase
MRRVSLLASIALMALAAGLCHCRAESKPGRDDLFICAYYPAWNQDNGRMPIDRIDFSAFSHIMHFCINPGDDGVIDPEKSGITSLQSLALVRAAHEAGCKVLVCLGGADSAEQIRKGLTDAARPKLVRSLVQFVTTRGYDGLDLDMEPIQNSDVPNFERLVHELRAQLNAADRRLLLTAAVAWQPAMFARLQPELDRINIMTYDLSGPWPGFESWYNAPILSGKQKMKAGGGPMPSADGLVQEWEKAGVAPRKLGIGVAFYGYVWTGVSGPQQNIRDVKEYAPVDYYAIMDQYYTPDRYHWDSRAKAPYLSVDAPQVPDRRFISFDDQRLCAAKVAYVRRRGLGGLIIWELGGGYRADQPAGRRDPLLQAIKRAWRRGCRH